MTKYRNKRCQVCGEDDKSKRRVCLKCKTDFPPQKSDKGGYPFNRKDEYNRKQKTIRKAKV